MESIIEIFEKIIDNPDDNTFAEQMLKFVCSFFTSFNDDEPPFSGIIKWIVSTNSPIVNIRYRLCRFTNMMLNELGSDAVIAEQLCDDIMEFMIDQLKDRSQSIREEAIRALARLQNPMSGNDPVTKSYFQHMTDQAPKVRRGVITAIAKTKNAIKAIQKRLQDVDETVRKTVYLQMSSYSVVKTYTNAQRLIFMEHGLSDPSKVVRKVVTNLMIKAWLESYNNNYVSLLSALLLNDNVKDTKRSIKVSKMVLLEIFKTQKTENVIELLQFKGTPKQKVKKRSGDTELDENDSDESDDDDNGGADEGVEFDPTVVRDFKKCVPLNELSIELSTYWCAMVKYFHKESTDDLDMIIPELSTYCQYLEAYLNQCTYDRFVMFNLIEILECFDYSDETGKACLKNIIYIILKDKTVQKNIIEKLVNITESIITDIDVRLQVRLKFFFFDVLRMSNF